MNAAALSDSAFPSALPLRQRAIILTLAVVAHGVLLAQPWLSAPGFSGTVPRELSVSIVMTSSSRQNALAPPLVKAVQPVSQPKLSETVSAEPQPDLQQHDTMHPPALPDTTDEPAQPAASGLPDREPDYRAAYLNNPQPDYPLAARRMGWQGRVLLEVEVLADGTSGEVTVKESSGRGVLDNAALRAVRGWRFVPARRGGQAVTQKFLVPLSFSLKDAA